MTEADDRPRRPLTEQEQDRARVFKSAWLDKKFRDGVTQEEAGAAMGMSASAFGQYINGKVPVGLVAALRLCQYLEVDPESVQWDEMLHPPISDVRAPAPAAQRIFQIAKERIINPRSIRGYLASICGISVQAVRAWEEGHTRDIRHQYIVAISDHFSVSAHWLLTGEGERDLTRLGDEGDRFLVLLSGLSDKQKQAVLALLESLYDFEGADK